MTAIARALTAVEAADAAAYFSALKPVSFIRVIETDRVPSTAVAGWTLVRDPNGPRVPIGDRVLEMATDFERFENRDSRTRYIAFAPPGSRQRGESLVSTGAGGRTLVCATCHGQELRGNGDIPRLAGRSPSYLARQLFDIQSGNRKGAAVVPMKPVVERLTEADIADIVAYIASLSP
jgi:cytochrome c553